MTAIISALATLAESVAAALTTTPADSRDGNAATTANSNPFESRAGLADVVTVQVVGPDGSVKDSRSTDSRTDSTINNAHESLTRKESRP